MRMLHCIINNSYAKFILPLAKATDGNFAVNAAFYNEACVIINAKCTLLPVLCISGPKHGRPGFCQNSVSQSLHKYQYHLMTSFCYKQLYSFPW